MRIIDISVTNFKSFARLDKLKLTKVNMVFGLNNSGKSNLLKLIEIIFRVKRNPESITQAIVDEKLATYTNVSEGNFWLGWIENEPFIFRSNNRNEPITFSFTIGLSNDEIISLGSTGVNLLSNFPMFGSEHILNFSGDIISINNFVSKMRVTDVVFNKIKIFDGKVYFPTIQASELLFDNQDSFDSLMSLMNNCVKFLDNDRYFDHEKEDSKLKTLSSRNVKNWLFNMSLEGFNQSKYKELIKMISTFSMKGDQLFKENEKSSPFSNWEIEFERIGEEIEIFFKNEFNRYPISSYGTGVQQIFFILLSIFYSKSKIILIEEIELNLSPKYQYELLQFIKNLSDNGANISQLVFTTHSPLFCYRGDFNLLKVTINNDGASVVVDVKRSDLEDFTNVAKLMIQE
ncbi:MAG: AAA family ATPase [Ignavibacterium sp.]|nr:AAA family ATPase [Ignavibacterium sp.]